MDNKKQRKKLLAKYKGQLPSRSRLGLESLFAASPEERSAAAALLKLLPADPEDHNCPWLEGQRFLQEFTESPAGRATLEMFKNSKPVGDHIANRDATDAKSPESSSTDTQLTNPSPPPIDPPVHPTNA